MKHHKLKEIAKLAAGLILADFVVWWWMAAHSILPTTFLGIPVNDAMVTPALIFDAAIFIILVHYGWHFGKTPQLSSKKYLHLVGIILGIVALIHLIRIFTGTDFVILGWQTPIWLSGVGTIIAAYLSYMSFRLAMKK